MSLCTISDFQISWGLPSGVVQKVAAPKLTGSLAGGKGLCSPSKERDPSTDIKEISIQIVCFKTF